MRSPGPENGADRNERGHSQDRHCGRGNLYGDGAHGHAAYPACGSNRRDREPFCRQICRGSFPADLHWRGARRPAREFRPGTPEQAEFLGDLLAEKAIAALGIEGAKAHSYGKAAAVGENGELEHAAAILHPKMGAPVRKVLGKGAALIPSSKKRSGPGTTLDIPLGHKDAAFVRSHFDGMEVQINDAPRANEIMVAVAITDSGRPLPRVGGLTVPEIKGEDGLR